MLIAGTNGWKAHSRAALFIASPVDFDRTGVNWFMRMSVSNDDDYSILRSSLTLSLCVTTQHRCEAGPRGEAERHVQARPLHEGSLERAASPSQASSTGARRALFHS